MSLHLYHQSQSQASTSAAQGKSLCLLCAYENGSVVLRKYDQKNKETSVEGVGWNIVWKSKLHVESSGKKHAFFCMYLSIDCWIILQSWLWEFHDRMILHWQYQLTISSVVIIYWCVQLYRKISQSHIYDFRITNPERKSLTWRRLYCSPY